MLKKLFLLIHFIDMKRHSYVVVVMGNICFKFQPDRMHGLADLVIYLVDICDWKYYAVRHGQVTETNSLAKDIFAMCTDLGHSKKHFLGGWGHSTPRADFSSTDILYLLNSRLTSHMG